MKVQLESLIEVNRSPHVWFAWFPVYVEEEEREIGTYQSKVYLVWLQKVNRKKVFTKFNNWYYIYWLCKE